jgi:hypothetical protein
MRQALHDRCREVVRSENSMPRLLIVELLPDLLGSLWAERAFSFTGFSHCQVAVWMAALSMTAAAVLSANWFGDWSYRNYNPRMVEN